MGSACKILSKLILCLTFVAPIFAEDEGPDCSKPLGMENRDIPDSRITSSSYATINGIAHPPDKARLSASETWISAQNDTNPYIQVDLGKEKQVSGVIVQGYRDRWIQYFIIKHGHDSESLVAIKDEDGNKPMIFEAVVDIGEEDEPYTIPFLTTITARVIRLEPQKDSCNNGRDMDQNHCALRFEILGCELPGEDPAEAGSLTTAKLLWVILGTVAVIVAKSS